MILNRQKKVPLAEQPLSEFLGKILQELNFAQAEVSIAFVSDTEMARWNQGFRRFPSGAPNAMPGESARL